MNHNTFENSGDSLEAELNRLLIQYETEHGEQIQEERQKLKETWRNAIKEKKIEDKIGN